MKPRLRAKLRAIGLVGGPILLLALNLGLWWGASYLNDYVASFPSTHFFVDDYEPQTLLKIKESIVSGAHRTAQGVLGGILGNIWSNKSQDLQKVLEQAVQPQDHYLGLIRPGEFCVITSETSGEIWCRRVVPAGERDGIPSWSWPAQTERPYLFTRLLPQLFLSSTNQLQMGGIESLVQRYQVYWLKPSTQPQLQHQSGYFYGDRLQNTVLQSRTESAALWAGRLQMYHHIQMVLIALLLVVSPISLTVFYWDRLASWSKSLSKKLVRWKRRRDAQRRVEAEVEAELIALEPTLEPQRISVPEGGMKMSNFIEEDSGRGTGLVPKSYYPAQASNPLMGAILGAVERWKIQTEIKTIEKLTELITVKTKYSEVAAQQVEAERQLATKLAESGGVTPRLINALEAQGYYRLVELLKQREELQDLEHQSKKLDKQIEVAEKERKLEELKRPARRRVSRREQEEREIRRIMTEAYSEFRKKVARVDAINKAAAKAKAHVRKRYQDNPQLLAEMVRKIDLWKDDDTQFIGTEYKEDENIL